MVDYLDSDLNAVINIKAHALNCNAYWLVTISIIVFCCINYFLLRRSMRKSLKNQILKQKLLNAQLTALRTQLNPHFIFNSLNTIQGLIIQADVMRGVQFIAKFSKLIRSILNNLDKQMILLKDEIENLQLYFSIEEIRFDQKFKYSLSCPEDILTFEIPSLVIQPIIEYVIWKNLKNGELNKIDVAFFKEGDKIICKINHDDKAHRTDGLSLSEKATALKLTASRLSMLNNKSNIEEGTVSNKEGEIVERIINITFDLARNRTKARA